MISFLGRSYFLSLRSSLFLGINPIIANEMLQYPLEVYLFFFQVLECLKLLQLRRPFYLWRSYSSASRWMVFSQRIVRKMQLVLALPNRNIVCFHFFQHLLKVVQVVFWLPFYHGTIYRRTHSPWTCILLLSQSVNKANMVKNNFKSNL